MKHERSPEELLQHVYRRARILRLRRLVSHAISGALAFSLVGGGVVFAFTRSPVTPAPMLHDQIVSMSSSPKASTDPKPSATAKPSTKPEPKPSSEPKTEPKTSPKPIVSEPKPDCLNSFDPACGEFFWKTAPAKNQAMTLNVTAPGTVQTGTDVAFSVHVADADAKIWREAYKIDFADGTRIYGPADKSCKKAYGPWALPTRAGDSYDTTFHHTYTSPGTYKIFVKFMSVDRRDMWPRPCQQAYGDYAYAEITIVVTDPEPSASPSP